MTVGVPPQRSREPRFSVVIPALNEEAVLGACLTSLAGQTYRGAVEVVVVDNGSTDDTAALARAYGVRVVGEPRPGVCFARQAGLSAARGEIVVTTDADTTFPADWLSAIDRQFVARPDAVAVAGPCAYAESRWWATAWTRLLFGVVAVVARLTGRVVYVTATNLAFRRDALDGYDTRMTQGGDELDVLRRLRRQGPVVFVPGNVTSTSSRRLGRGLLYTAFVSVGYYYLLGYLVNRVARRRLLGSAPYFRLGGTRPERRDRTGVIERRIAPPGAGTEGAA